MSKLYNRVKMSVSSTGTGTLTLNAAVTGFLSFSAGGVQNGDTVSYVIEDGANWEIGTGTYTSSGTTVTRSVTSSSNSNTAISVTTSAVIYLTALAGDIVNTANNLSDLANTSTARTNLGLGSAATQSSSAFLQASNNLSEVTAATARTNLGLGTAATLNVGTSANNVVQLTSGAALPAVSATNLTTIPMANANGTLPVANGGTGSTTAATALSALGGLSSSTMFGDGSDGAVTISSGTTTLSRNMYYSSLTISGTGSLNTNGYAVYVSGTLTITSAPANAIYSNGADGSSIASGTPSSVTRSASGYDAGQTSGAGLALNQSPANGKAATSANILGGVGGVGGTYGSYTGGAQASNIFPIERIIRPMPYFLVGNPTYTGGGPGNGGANNSISNGPSASGATGGGIVYIAANTINRGNSTAASSISAIGGNGGNQSTQTNGGAGGGGGGGGFICIIAGSLSGATATNAISANGGTGGNGKSGNGGQGGSGGNILFINISAQTITFTSGTSGSTPSTATGGTGGTCTASI